LRRLTAEEAEAQDVARGIKRPREYTLSWLQQLFEKNRRRKSEYRSGGFILGHAEADEWHGYLKLSQSLTVNVRAEYAADIEKCIEIYPQHPDWNVGRQPRILMELTGRKTYRGIIEYPEFVERSLGVNGEWFSLDWMYGSNPRKVGGHDVAFRIRIGGMQLARGGRH
jgi:hypothetical protein